MTWHHTDADRTVRTSYLGGSSSPARRYVLDSGLSIATYCPADGSVVPVSTGDQLYDGTTGLWLTAMETGSGPTMEWCGGEVSLDPDGATVASISSTYADYHSLPWASDAAAVWVIGVAMVLASTGSAHDATHRYSIQLVLYGSAGSELISTNGLTGDERIYHADINIVADCPAEGSDPGHYARQCRMKLEKKNSPDNMSAKFGGIRVRYIYR